MTAIRLCAVALLVVGVLASSACQKGGEAQTTIPATWRNPGLPPTPFSKIFVIGVGRNDSYRRLYEDSMAKALSGQGVTAQASYTLFPEPGKLDSAKVLVEVEERGFDAVVIARLKSVHEETKYVAAAPLTSSDLYMSGYDEAYAVNSSPAHYEKSKTYRVETTLYSARDEMLAWVGLSDTVHPDSVEDIIQSVSARVARQMKAEGLIGVPPNTPPEE